MPMIPLIIGAGMGLLNASEQAKEEAAQRQIAAATIAYSPYTGANINQAESSIHPAKYIASTGAGALAGLAAYQGNAAGALKGLNGSPGSEGPAGSATGDSTPQGSSFNLRNAASQDRNVGGMYGYGPPPGQFQSGPAATYGAPWPVKSPYWDQNPYGGS